MADSVVGTVVLVVEEVLDVEDVLDVDEVLDVELVLDVEDVLDAGAVLEVVTVDPFDVGGTGVLVVGALVDDAGTVVANVVWGARVVGVVEVVDVVGSVTVDPSFVPSSARTVKVAREPTRSPMTARPAKVRFRDSLTGMPSRSVVPPAGESTNHCDRNAENFCRNRANLMVS